MQHASVSAEAFGNRVWFADAGDARITVSWGCRGDPWETELDELHAACLPRLPPACEDPESSTVFNDVEEDWYLYGSVEVQFLWCQDENGDWLRTRWPRVAIALG